MARSTPLIFLARRLGAAALALAVVVAAALLREPATPSAIARAPISQADAAPGPAAALR